MHTTTIVIRQFTVADNEATSEVISSALTKSNSRDYPENEETGTCTEMRKVFL